MFEKIKRHPFVWVSLAVACGLVLAHVANEAADYFWENYLDDFLTQYGWTLFGLTLAAGLLALIVWKRSRILDWTDGHRTAVVVGSLLMFLVIALVVIRDANQQQAAAAPVTLDFSKAVPIK